MSPVSTPQGHSLTLSPVLFPVYLVEAALRDLRSRLAPRPLVDANLQFEVEYADDTDFISTSRLFLDHIERIAPAGLVEWSLTINASKTERSSVCRHADRVDEEWRMSRYSVKLKTSRDESGSSANVTKVKLCCGLCGLGVRELCLQLRLRFYASFVMFVLTYNMGTWGLAKAETSPFIRDNRHPLATSHLQHCAISGSGST